MPKKYFQWEVHIWCSVHNLRNNEWEWSHASTRVVCVRAETEDDARSMIVPTLRPAHENLSVGIKTTSEYIYDIYCRGAMQKVTEWKVVNKDARPSYKRRK